MAKMNIYIPDELKVRMDERNENWSAIAQRAFEIQLNSTTLTGGENMSAVVERLRASKAKIEDQERPERSKAGREWAMNDAEYGQLERVAAIDTEGERHHHGDDPASSLLYEVAMAIYDKPKHDPVDRFDIDEASEIIFGDIKPSFKRLLWWIEGATEVWDEVKDQV